MSQPWASRSIVVCSFLALTFPLSASPAPLAGDPCKQMHRDLDRQIDGVKTQQKDSRNQCADSYGESSDACRSLKDQQEQNLRTMRDERKGRLAGCNGSTVLVLSATPLPAGNTYDLYDQNRGDCVEYPYLNCNHKEHYVHVKHHPHHPPHQPPPPPPGPGGAGKVASRDTGKPTGGGQGPSDRRPGTDSSTAKGTGAPGSVSGDHGHNTHNSGNSGGSGSRSTDNSSSSHSGSSYSGSSSGQSSSSSSGGGGSSYSGSSSSGSSSSGSSSSGSSYSGGSSSSPSRDAGPAQHDSGATRPK